jgi:hypothetical protein
MDWLAFRRVPGMGRQGRAMAERHEGGEEYSLTIRAQRSDVAPAIRLRAVLKALLRQYDFRAVDVRETTPVLPPLPAAHGAGGTADR